MGAIAVVGGCEDERSAIDRETRINQIQVIGSHNSYKQPIDASLMQVIREASPETAESLDYAHVPLAKQLDLGVRKFELDVYHDPEGGRYADPLGVRRVAELGLPPGPPYDPTGAMRRPGFKVMHVQDIDFRSHCPTFKDALRQLLAWSDAHPGHLPVFVMVEGKARPSERPDFVQPLPFTKGALDSLDAEIRDVIPAERLITPDEVRGAHETLEAAVLSGHWPTLEDARGRFLLYLHNQVDAYREDHPSLSGRAMFVRSTEGEPEAAIIALDNPVRDQDRIQDLVRKGYIVRTRSDTGTRQARSGDTSRLDAALSSGAQIISTDYYSPEERFGTGYVARFPGDTVARFNPIAKPGETRHKLLE